MATEANELVEGKKEVSGDGCESETATAGDGVCFIGLSFSTDFKTR